MTEKKKLPLSKIDTERAVVTYLNLALRYENRNEIGFEKFSMYWNSLFSIKGHNDSIKLKRKAYKEICDVLRNMSIAEIQEYRDSICIFAGMQVPKEILELANTKTKDLKICLAQNRNKNLSGFDILVRYNHRDTLRLNRIPFGLSEKEVIEVVKAMPIRSVLVSKEKELMDLLKDENISVTKTSHTNTLC